MAVVNPITHDKQQMHLGDGYMLFAVHHVPASTPTAGDKDYHSSGEVLLHGIYDLAGGGSEIGMHSYFSTGASLRTTWVEDADELAHFDDSSIIETNSVFAGGIFGGTHPDGTKIALSRTLLENEISQEMASIETLIIGETIDIEIKLKQINARRLIAVMGGDPSNDLILNELAGDSPMWTVNDIVERIQSFGIGGTSTMPFYSGLLRINDPRASTAAIPRYKWLYIPSFQFDPNCEITFVKNDFAQVVGKLKVKPSKQVDALSSGKYTQAAYNSKLTTIYYNMLSNEGKGMLARMLNEDSLVAV